MVTVILEDIAVARACCSLFRADIEIPEIKKNYVDLISQNCSNFKNQRHKIIDQTMLFPQMIIKTRHISKIRWTMLTIERSFTGMNASMFLQKKFFSIKEKQNFNFLS